MKKKAKKRLPGSKVKKQRKFTRKKQRQQIQYGIGQKMINSVVIALDEDDKIHVRKIVEGLDEYDLARLIEALDFNHRRRLVEILGDHIDPEVFPELNEIVQEQVIETLEHMDDKEQKSIIEQLDPELKYQVESSLNYPEDSAGRIMSRDFVSMPDDWTVKEAKQYLLSDTELPDEFYTIFLTDSSSLRMKNSAILWTAKLCRLTFIRIRKKWRICFANTAGCRRWWLTIRGGLSALSILMMWSTLSTRRPARISCISPAPKKAMCTNRFSAFFVRVPSG